MSYSSQSRERAPAGQVMEAVAHALPMTPVSVAGQVVEAVAHAVTALPAEQRRAALAAMLAPLVTPLQAALVAPAGGGGAAGAGGALPGPPASAALVIQLVDRLTAVFRCAAAGQAMSPPGPPGPRSVRCLAASTALRQPRPPCLLIDTHPNHSGCRDKDAN